MSFNGTTEKWAHVRLKSAKRGKADVKRDYNDYRLKSGHRLQKAAPDWAWLACSDFGTGNISFSRCVRAEPAISTVSL
jgi:hypothetical protein